MVKDKKSVSVKKKRKKTCTYSKDYVPLYCDKKINWTKKIRTMDKEMLERLISQKEKEIRDLQKFAKMLGKEHIEKQIDLRLEDLKKLYEKRK